ncbi:MAG: hypothetical protein WDM85_07200 [Caulobacteraceae bacterium]
MAGLWPALAMAADADATSQTPVATQSISPTAKSAQVSEIVVNGIPYKETVLPTRMSSSSVYGLDLGVMDTPRNTTPALDHPARHPELPGPRAPSPI